MKGKIRIFESIKKKSKHNMSEPIISKIKGSAINLEKYFQKNDKGLCQ